MRLSTKRSRELAASRDVSLSALLRESRVSRNAYDSLARRESAFPVDRLVAEARRIAAKIPGIELENVWHTLLVLREPPLARLRGSLRRGRAAPLW